MIKTKFLEVTRPTGFIEKVPVKSLVVYLPGKNSEASNTLDKYNITDNSSVKYSYTDFKIDVSPQLIIDTPTEVYLNQFNVLNSHGSSSKFTINDSHKDKLKVEKSDGTSVILEKEFSVDGSSATYVSTSDNSIAILKSGVTEHFIQHGQPILYTKDTTDIGGLLSGTTYYAINELSRIEFDQKEGIANATEIITTKFNKPHGLKLGDYIQYYGADSITNLTDFISYYVVSTPSRSTFTISASSGGSSINLSALSTTGTHYFYPRIKLGSNEESILTRTAVSITNTAGGTSHTLKLVLADYDVTTHFNIIYSGIFGGYDLSSTSQYRSFSTRVELLLRSNGLHLNKKSNKSTYLNFGRAGGAGGGNMYSQRKNFVISEPDIFHGGRYVENSPNDNLVALDINNAGNSTPLLTAGPPFAPTAVDAASGGTPAHRTILDSGKFIVSHFNEATAVTINHLASKITFVFRGSDISDFIEGRFYVIKGTGTATRFSGGEQNMLVKCVKFSAGDGGALSGLIDGNSQSNNKYVNFDVLLTNAADTAIVDAADFTITGIFPAAIKPAELINNTIVFTGHVENQEGIVFAIGTDNAEGSSEPSNEYDSLKTLQLAPTSTLIGNAGEGLYGIYVNDSGAGDIDAAGENLGNPGSGYGPNYEYEYASAINIFQYNIDSPDNVKKNFNMTILDNLGNPAKQHYIVYGIPFIDGDRLSTVSGGMDPLSGLTHPGFGIYDNANYFVENVSVKKVTRSGTTDLYIPNSYQLSKCLTYNPETNKFLCCLGCDSSGKTYKLITAGVTPGDSDLASYLGFKLNSGNYYYMPDSNGNDSYLVSHVSIAEVHKDNAFITTPMTIASATIHTGGTGHALNNVITLAIGSAAGTGTPAQLKVTGVSGGVITSVTVEVPGEYTVAPSGNISQASTTGTGSGAAFQLILAEDKSRLMVSGNGIRTGTFKKVLTQTNGNLSYKVVSVLENEDWATDAALKNFAGGGYDDFDLKLQCDTTNNSSIVTHEINRQIMSGLVVSGAGIPTNSIIRVIDDTSFRLVDSSNDYVLATATASNITLDFHKSEVTFTELSSSQEVSAKADSNEQYFILGVDEYDIKNRTNNTIIKNKLILPNNKKKGYVNSRDNFGFTSLKNKKYNYVSTLQPKAIRELNCTLTTADGSSSIFPHNFGNSDGYISDTTIYKNDISMEFIFIPETIANDVVFD